MRVVFMGSPAEAIESLRILHGSQDQWGIKLCAIVSQPARPAGRNRKLQDPPVAVFAQQHRIPLYQPENAKDGDFLEQLQSIRPDVVITAAYGQILSDAFLAIPRRATINIHPSLLPQYRGATPIPSALLSGARISGVTILFTVKKLDAGAIIIQEPFALGENKTSGELMPEMFRLGGELLRPALDKLRDEGFEGQPQREADVSYCGKFDKQDGLVDWTRSARTIMNRYRAFTPWPGVFTFHDGTRVKIVAMEPAQVESSLTPGTFRVVGDKLEVGTGDGVIAISQLMRAGSKITDGKGFVNGLKRGAVHQFSDEGKA